MHTLHARERSVAQALALAPWAMQTSRALNAPVLCASLVRGPCVVLGAAQRAGRVIDLTACARDKTPVFRRASSGQAAYVGGRAVVFSLALPHVAALAPDARFETLLNRNVRGFLRGFTRAGALSSYFGRDWISVGRRPFAALGYEVSRDGVVLIEVMTGVESALALPDAVVTDTERALVRWWDRAPLSLAEASPEVDPLRFAETTLEVFSRDGRKSLEEPELQVFTEVTEPSDPAGRALGPGAMKLVPIGVLEALKVGCAGGTEALWLGGDALAARWIYEDVAKGRAVESFGDDLPLAGARLEDLFAVVDSARHDAGG